MGLSSGNRVAAVLDTLPEDCTLPNLSFKVHYPNHPRTVLKNMQEPLSLKIIEVCSGVTKFIKLILTKRNFL